MRTFAYVLMAIFIVLLQGVVIPYVVPTMWQPNLILIGVIVITALLGRQSGMTAAVVGGLVHDIILSNFFGLHLLAYVAVSYIVSLRTSPVYEDQWLTTAITVAIGTLLAGLIHMLWLWAIHAGVTMWSYMFHFIMLPMVVNGIVGIPFHYMIYQWKEREDYSW